MLKMGSYWLACACLLAAAPASPAEEKVQVTVVAILATERNKNVDPELKEIARTVQKSEPTLTGFRMGRISAKALTVGQPSQFPLVEKEAVSIVVDHGADKNNRVGLTVKPPQLREISYSTNFGKFFPIVTGFQTQEKERLILAIMVEPAK